MLLESDRSVSNRAIRALSPAGGGSKGKLRQVTATIFESLCWGGGGCLAGQTAAVDACFQGSFPVRVLSRYWFYLSGPTRLCLLCGGGDYTRLSLITLYLVRNTPPPRTATPPRPSLPAVFTDPITSWLLSTNRSLSEWVRLRWGMTPI